MKRTVTFILLLSALTGCEKEFYDLSDIRQEILFKSEFMNAAWGYHHNGILITKEGEIYGFNLPEGWNLPDEKGVISSSLLMENLVKADTLLGKVEPGDLINYLNKLYDVDPDNLSDPETQMYDAGVRTFSGYIYDEKTDKYREVLLRQTGDLYIENMSREAAKIYKWLLEQL